MPEICPYEPSCRERFTPESDSDYSPDSDSGFTSSDFKSSNDHEIDDTCQDCCCTASENGAHNVGSEYTCDYCDCARNGADDVEKSNEAVDEIVKPEEHVEGKMGTTAKELFELSRIMVDSLLLAAFLAINIAPFLLTFTCYDKIDTLGTALVNYIAATSHQFRLGFIFPVLIAMCVDVAGQRRKLIQDVRRLEKENKVLWDYIEELKECHRVYADHVKRLQDLNARLSDRAKQLIADLKSQVVKLQESGNETDADQSRELQAYREARKLGEARRTSDPSARTVVDGLSPTASTSLARRASL